MSYIFQGEAVLYDGQVEGLSKMYRGGTCTLDKVASWVFLYANLADENLQVCHGFSHCCWDVCE